MPRQTDDDDLVMSLVESALAQPRESRQSYLQSVCLDDPELFSQVWTYVQSEERMQGFLQEPFYPATPLERPFDPGQLLDGRFRIVREVAEGGMGIVYEAFDEKLERRIALKCAKTGFDKRLPPEVRNAREISHPNVCKIFEIHTASTPQGDIDFLTMEFLEGETLAVRLRRGPFAEKEAREIARQLCAGLAEAHRSHVVHGDLKSSNVILTTGPDGSIRAVITDFGLARESNSHRRTVQSGELGGTFEYMAPELWKGEKASESSDIYALGVILYELIAGELPYAPELRPEERQTRRPPPVHPKWDRVVALCLAADPHDRFGRVEDVIRTLEPVKTDRRLAAVAAALLIAVTIAAGALTTFRDKDSAATSVAVIPFVNDGLSAEKEYLSDGIPESLIYTLAQFPDLKMIARSSSFQFKHDGMNLQDVAQRLGANLLVTGRISEIDGRVRVTAELVNGAKGVQLWGERYDMTNGDLGGLEQRMVKQIAEQIGARLTNTTQSRLSKSIGANPQAYELLLRGQYQIRLYTPESRQKAIGYFEEALVVDPELALANAALANAYRLLSGGGLVDPNQAMSKAEAAARRALAVDPDLAEAHAALADISKDHWQWATAEKEYLRAIELSPSLASAHMGYGIFLSVMGRYDTAVAEVEKVRKLDPVGLPAALHAAAVHYNGRHYADALNELARARELDPSAPTPWMWMGMVYGGSGRYREAVEAYQQAQARGDDTAATQCFYVYSLAKSGQRNAAQEILDRLLKTNQFIPLTALAVAHIGLDQKERSIQLLQQAYTSSDPILQYLKVESHFDTLKDRREYSDLAAKMGLP